MPFLRRTLIVTLAALAAALALAVAVPLPAHAGRYVVHSCATPRNTPVEPDLRSSGYGWLTLVFGAAPGFSVDGSCQDDGKFGIRISGARQPQGSGVALRFIAPPDTHIDEIEQFWYGHARHDPAGVDAAYGDVRLNSSDMNDPYYRFRHVNSGTFGDASHPWSGANYHRFNNMRLSWFELFAGCAGRDATVAACPGRDDDIARFSVHRIGVYLVDDNAPIPGEARGSLVEGDPIAGATRLRFNATDAGGGLYGIHFYVDGKLVESAPVNGQWGDCEALRGGGPHEFGKARPCPVSSQVDRTVWVSQWPEGRRHIQIRVEDAGGNTSTVWEGHRTIDNIPPPANVTRPRILGDAQAGRTLTGDKGRWEHNPTSVTGEWHRCTVANKCTREFGDVETIRARPEDAGYVYRFVVAGSSAEGRTVAASADTDVIRRADGSIPGCADGADNDGDRKVDLADIDCDDPGDDTEAVPSSPTPSTTPSSGSDPTTKDSEGGVQGAQTASHPGAAAAPPAGPKPNGDTATRNAKLTVAWARGRRTLSIRFGSRPVARGRLTDAATGKGIANARIETVHVLPARLGRFDKGGARTRADGRFTLVLPANLSSRDIVWGYRAFENDATYAATRRLALSVRARSTLTARPRRVRNGQSVLFAGRVMGPFIPRRGVVVLLQARVDGVWTTFRTVRTNRAGRWSRRYRFSRTFRPATFVFRARVVEDSRYPFAAGGSGITRVRVR